MRFVWQNDPPLNFPSDFGDGYRLPKYVVSFVTDNQSHNVYYGEGNHSTARMKITMSREIRSHLLETYLPSSLFVIMSWGGFCVIPEVVPGRMVLLVTTLLSLVTMFDTVRNNSPSALELKCIEVWLISCTLFVFFALLEYFIVLFGIRYEKHWRHTKQELDLQIQSNNHHIVAAPDRTSRLRLFATSKICKLQENNGEAAQSEAEEPPKLAAVAEYIILYCGSQRGILDQVSLTLFPLSFLVFTVVYWVTYLNEAKQRSNL